MFLIGCFNQTDVFRNQTFPESSASIGPIGKLGFSLSPASNSLRHMNGGGGNKGVNLKQNDMLIDRSLIFNVSQIGPNEIT